MAPVITATRAPQRLIAADVPPRRWLGVLGLTALLGAWQLLAWRLADPATLAPPLEVARSFVKMLYEPFAGSTLVGHAAASLQRFAAGFLLSLVVGVPLGLTMGASPVASALITPVFNLLRFIAPIAWVPFAVLWFGTGFGGPLLIIFSGAFPACVLGAYGGARMTEPRLIEAARTLGANPLRIVLEVTLPSALPAIVSGMRVAAGSAWQSLVGAELIVASSGLAYTMVRGQMNRTIVIVLVGMLAIGLIGLALDTGFAAFEKGIGRRQGRVSP